jgi:hypothetical protein
MNVHQSYLQPEHVALTAADPFALQKKPSGDGGMTLNLTL